MREFFGTLRLQAGSEQVLKYGVTALKVLGAVHDAGRADVPPKSLVASQL